MEKARRKIEGDLHVTTEAVGDLERAKNEIAQAVQRKEKEMAAIAAKMEDEQTLGSKMQKQVKELAVSYSLSREKISCKCENARRIHGFQRTDGIYMPDILFGALFSSMQRLDHCLRRM